MTSSVVATATLALAAFVAGCSSDTPEIGPLDDGCGTSNEAFEAGCEPHVAPCGAVERLAESYRGTFGSVNEDGGCQTDWPAPILADCTEPLSEGVPDLRGLWTSAVQSERVEQCGNLVLIVGRQFVHGGYATGVPEDGVNDFRATSNCTEPLQVALSYVDNALHFVAAGNLVVTRALEVAPDGQDELVWSMDIGLATGGTSSGLSERARMRRVCDLAALETN